MSMDNHSPRHQSHSGTDQNDDFELEKIPQFFDENGDHPFHPHIHHCYQIVWFIQGTGKHYVDFHEYPVEGQHVVFVSPGQIHWFDKTSRFDGVIIQFDESYLSDESQNDNVFLKYNIFNAFDDKPCFKVSDACARSLSSIIEDIREELTHKNDFAHAEYLNHLIKLFLIHIQRMGGAKAPFSCSRTTAHPHFVKFRQMIEQHYRQLHTAKEYALYEHHNK